MKRVYQFFTLLFLLLVAAAATAYFTNTSLLCLTDIECIKDRISEALNGKPDFESEEMTFEFNIGDLEDVYKVEFVNVPIDGTGTLPVPCKKSGKPTGEVAELFSVERGFVTYSVDLLDPENISYRPDSDSTSIYVRTIPKVKWSINSRTAGEIQLNQAPCLSDISEVPGDVVNRVLTQTSSAFDENITTHHKWAEINGKAAAYRAQLVLDLENRGLIVVSVDNIGN